MDDYEAKAEAHRRREQRQEKSRKEMEAVMQLAGFTVSRVWELANQYWPLHADYDDAREPWWLFMTVEMGPIQIGWRKRVLSIRWDATAVRSEVTRDEVTKGDDHVHAWNMTKALEYLTSLRAIATAASPAPPAAEGKR